MKTSFSARLIGRALVGMAILAGIGLLFGTKSSPPTNLLLYWDIDAKTYLAPSCMTEWVTRPPGNRLKYLRNGTIAEAHAKNFAPDETCAKTGAFTFANRSTTGQALVFLGVLSPIKPWWEGPCRVLVKDPYKQEDCIR